MKFNKLIGLCILFLFLLSTSVFAVDFDIRDGVYEKNETFSISVFRDIGWSVDGSSFYYINQSNDFINQNICSNNFEIDSCTFDYDFDTLTSSPNNFKWKPDGTEFYILDDSDDNIDQFSCSTAWDLESCSFTAGSSFSSFDATPRSFNFKSDGTKIYVHGFSNDVTKQISCSTAWDITSCTSYDSISLACPDSNNLCYDTFFSTDGTKFFFTGDQDDNVWQYDCSSAWSLNTCILEYTRPITETSIVRYFYLNDDYNRFYISGTSVFQYNFVSNFSITATDVLTNLSINSFNANITGDEFYSTTGSLIITNILEDNTSLFTIEVCSSGYSCETYNNVNVSENLIANLTALPLEDFSLTSPTTNETRDNSWDIEWTEAVSPAGYDVNYTINIKYSNSTIKDTFTTQNLFYNWDISSYPIGDFTVEVEAKEQYSNDTFTHSGTLDLLPLTDFFTVNAYNYNASLMSSVNIEETTKSITQTTNPFSYDIYTFLTDYDDSYTANVIIKDLNGNNRNKDQNLVITRSTNEFNVTSTSSLATITFNDFKTASPIENASVSVEMSIDGVTYIDFYDLTTDSNGDIEFNTNIVGVDYNYARVTFEGTQGYVSPISFIENMLSFPYSNSHDIARASLTINAYDRETGNLLNGVNVSLKILGLLDTVTTNGTYFNDSITISPNTYTLQAISDGYFTEEKVFTYTGQEELELSVYLLNLTGDNTGTLFVSVIDEFFRIMPETQVSLLEFNFNTEAYEEVSQCETNVNGECVFAVELNVKTYRLIATKLIDDVIFSTRTSESGEILRVDNEVRQLVLRLSDTFETSGLDNIIYEIIENVEPCVGGGCDENKTKVVSFDITFISTDGTDKEVCLEFVEKLISGEDQIFRECATSSTAQTSINKNYILDKTKNYEARVVLVQTGGDLLLKSFIYQSEDSIENVLDEDNYSRPIILIIMLCLIVLFFYLKNIPALCVTLIIYFWISLSWFPNILIIIGSTVKTIVLLFVMHLARKKKDGVV